MLRFYIPNMACGGCARSVTQALSHLAPEARIETDTATRQVRIEAQVDEQAILAALEQAGFPARRQPADAR